MANGTSGPEIEADIRGEPELIVVAKADAAVQVTPEGLASATGASVSDLEEILSDEGVELMPLFTGVGDDPSLAAQAPDDEETAQFFYVDAPEDRLEAIASRLNEAEAVEAAYVKPPAEPARQVLEREGLNLMEPDLAAAPATSPDYRSRQQYLDAAPIGIDAPYAWTLPGGRGQGVRVIDCEWGWQLTHEDLLVNALGIVAGTNHFSTNHGTAVMGEIGGDRNAFGVLGISPDAGLGASSFVGQHSAQAIDSAANALSAGDVILLEIHRPGPNHSVGGTQQGFIGIEWWPDDFAAIRRAVNKGIIVVEAAGNGWENLDDAIYDTPLGTFPSTWRNPFRLTNPQCGAVMVGAGNPPHGIHGRTTSPGPWSEPYVDRARCGFSNWGARVDAQGWGWEVTTAGYGDLQGGADKNRWYTDRFSGTSSASPIVTGALTCVQGVLKAKSMPLLTSWRARQLLRSTGTPQQPAPGRPVSQRIGNRPNLRQLIPAALKTWVSNTTIRYTYATSGSQSAWAYVDGIGWRRIRTGAPDGVSNVFTICAQAQASGKNVNVYLDDANLYSVVQL